MAAPAKSSLSKYSSLVKKISLKGIFPAITTPFDDSEEVSYEKLHENLQQYEKVSFAGYLINGSNGEVSAVTVEERVEILRKVRDWIDPHRILIANAYSDSTKQTCNLTKILSSNGADAVLVMLPFYHRRQLKEEDILAHFQAVADSSPVPVVVYNNAGVTNINISVDVILKLAEHPNICGVKESDAQKIAEIMAVVRDKGLDFEVTTGLAGSLLQSLLLGASGGMMALPNILGKDICQLYQLYGESNLQQAAELQSRLIRVDSLLGLSNLGVPGMKAALNLMGYYGGPCRLPLQPLAPQDLKRLKNLLVDTGFL